MLFVLNGFSIAIDDMREHSRQMFDQSLKLAKPRSVFQSKMTYSPPNQLFVTGGKGARELVGGSPAMLWSTRPHLPSSAAGFGCEVSERTDWLGHQFCLANTAESGYMPNKANTKASAAAVAVPHLGSIHHLHRCNPSPPAGRPGP